MKQQTAIPCADGYLVDDHGWHGPVIDFDWQAYGKVWPQCVNEKSILADLIGFGRRRKKLLKE